MTVARSTVLRNVRGGIYRVSAAKVKSRYGTAYPKTSAHMIKMPSRTGGVVTVDYRNVIGAKTKAVPVKKVRSISQPNSAGLVRVKLSGAAAYKPGVIIASSQSAAVPSGMLVKVLKVVGTRKGVTTYVTRQATLQEAIPQGSFSVHVPATLNLNATPGTAPRAGIAKLTVPAPSNRKTVQCSSSAELGVEATAHGGIDTLFTGEWNALDPASSAIKVTATATAEASTRAWISGAADCKMDPTQIGSDLRLPAIRFFIGTIPVVINPTLGWFVSASANAGAKVEAKSTAKISSSIWIRANRRAMTHGSTPAAVAGTSELTVEGSAKVAAQVTARLTGKLYGIAGPHVSVSVGPEATADINADPWWTVNGQLKAGGGIAVHNCAMIFLKPVCVQFDKSRDDIFTKSWPLLHANGRFGPLPAPAVSAPIVSVTADRPTVRAGELTGLHATVANASALNVSWRIDAGAPGAIDANGSNATYSAPSTPGTYRVYADLPAQGSQPASTGYTDILVVSSDTLWSHITPTDGSPLIDVALGDNLKCGVQRNGDVFGAFYNNGSSDIADSACATNVAVDGQVFGPANVPASGDNWDPYTPVSPAVLTGTGQPTNPWHLDATAAAGSTGVSVRTQMDYIAGDDSILVTLTASNSSVAAHNTILYQGGDCYIADNDFGFGILEADGSVSCNTAPDGTGRALRFTPLSAGSNRAEAFYGDYWALVAAGVSLPGSAADGYHDSAAGLSWQQTVQPGGSVTIQARITVTG